MTTSPSVGESKRLGVAVVGCGPIGQLHAQAVAASGCAELVAVCDLDAGRADTLANRYRVTAYEQLDELLAREMPDVVTIATPDHLHVAPALAAIAAGCHVFCEKPLAESADEAEQLVQAAEGRGVSLGVDYNRRFAFGYRTARRLLDAGTIGELQYCLVRVSDPVPPPQVARHPHVIFTTLLTHHFDLLRFFGGDIRRVQARCARRPPEELVATVSVSLEFISGAIGTIVAAYRQGETRTSEWMELGGSDGSLTIEDITRRVVLTACDPDHRETFEPALFSAGPAFYDSLIEHVQAFLDALAAGRPPDVCGHDGRAGLELAEAAIESLAFGRPIEIQR